MNAHNQDQGVPSNSDHPIAGRETVHNFHEQVGKISFDGNNYLIQSNSENFKLLMPVNLDAEFQTDGLNIIFSGEIKQAGPAEFWAAQPMLITAIRKGG